MNANTRLDDREKALLNAEGEVAILNRRIQALEEELEKTEDRFVTNVNPGLEGSLNPIHCYVFSFKKRILL